MYMATLYKSRAYQELFPPVFVCIQKQYIDSSLRNIIIGIQKNLNSDRTNLVVSAGQNFHAQDVSPVSRLKLHVAVSGGRVEQAHCRVVGARGDARAGLVPTEPVHAPCPLREDNVEQNPQGKTKNNRTMT